MAKIITFACAHYVENGPFRNIKDQHTGFQSLWRSEIDFLKHNSHKKNVEFNDEN